MKQKIKASYKEGETMKKYEMWKDIFEDFKESEMPIRGYCTKNNVSRDQFRYWKDKLRLNGYKFSSPYAATHESVKEIPTSFVEIKLDNILNTDDTISFCLSGIKVTLDCEKNKYFLKQLIKKLEVYL